MTILPALAAQEGAAREWMYLSLTMEALTRYESWEFAREYCDLVLQRCIPSGLSFRKVDDQILRDMQRARVGKPLPRPPQQERAIKPPKKITPASGSAPLRPADRRNACFDWNSAKGCSHQPCRFAHKCFITACGGAHRSSECPSKAMPPLEKAAGAFLPK